MKKNISRISLLLSLSIFIMLCFELLILISSSIPIAFLISCSENTNVIKVETVITNKIIQLVNKDKNYNLVTYYFNYNNDFKNKSLLCNLDMNEINCLYNINDNLTLYLKNDIFNFNIDYSSCAGVGISIFPVCIMQIVLLATSVVVIPYIIYNYMVRLI
jgi:hypothetical protein